MEGEPEKAGFAEIAAALRRRREERGLSLADAQAGTRIRMKYLQALEEGDVAALPEPVYVRGFLRAYADYLGLDGPSLVESFDRWRREMGGMAGADPTGGERATAASPSPLAAARRPGGAPRPRRRRRTAGRWLAAAFLLLAGLYVVGAWPEKRPAPTGTPAAVGGVGGSGTARGPQEGGRRGDGVEGAGAKGSGPTGGGPLAGASPAPEEVTKGGRKEPPAGQGVAATPAAALDVRQAAYGRRWEVAFRAPVPAAEVAIRVSDRCWVRAVADGRTVYEGVLQAGEERRFAGRESVRLRLGNPAAAAVTVNGHPLPSLGAEPVDVVVSAAAGAAAAEAPPPARP